MTKDVLITLLNDGAIFQNHVYMSKKNLTFAINLVNFLPRPIERPIERRLDSTALLITVLFQIRT